jgi:hypothetical protein
VGEELPPPPRLGVHDNLEAALDDEEEVDAQPDRQREIQIAVVRIEFNLNKRIVNPTVSLGWSRSRNAMRLLL